MSVKLMSQVWELKLEDRSLKLLLLALADSANDEGICWPNMHKLMAKTELSERTIQLKIKILEEKKLLIRQARYRNNGSQTSNLYVLFPDNNPDLIYEDIPGFCSELHPLPATSCAPPPATDCTPYNHHNDPSIKQKENTKRKVAPKGAVAQARRNEAVQIFEHWKFFLSHPRAVLDRKRERLLTEALKKYSLEECLTAVEGCVNSEWHQGKNDRNKVYDDIELIFRDSAHIERFIALGTVEAPEEKYAA